MATREVDHRRNFLPRAATDFGRMKPTQAARAFDLG